MTNFKLNFDKYCEYCCKKIRWYHKLEFTLTDPETNKLVRKDKILNQEQFDRKQYVIDLYHRGCLLTLIKIAQDRLTNIMKERKNIRDEDLI